MMTARLAAVCLAIALCRGNLGFAQTSASPPQPAPAVQQLLDQARTERQAFHWEKAFQLYSQAAEKARELHDRTGEVAALVRLGSAYGDTGNFARATATIEQALEISRAAGDDAGRRLALSNLGAVAYSQGHLPQAREYYQQALDIATARQDREAQADDSLGLANLYGDLGDLQRSVEMYRSAERVYVAAGDKIKQGMILGNLGINYFMSGQSTKAIENLKRAREIFEAAGEKRAVGNCLTALGGINGSIYRYDAALPCFEQALRLARLTQDRQGEAIALNGMGGAYSGIGRMVQAGECYQKAYDISKKIGDIKSQTVAVNNLASVASMRGRYREAVSKYTQVLNTFRATGSVYDQIVALSGLGANHDYLGERKTALAEFRLMMGLEEKMRRNLEPGQAASLSFGESARDAYVRYLDLLSRAGSPSASFEFLQKMKARTLLDQQANGRVDILTRLSSAEREKLATLRAETDRLNRAMIAHTTTPDVAERLRHAEHDLSSYVDVLTAAHPDVARARQTHTVSAPEAARLLGPDSALVEYAMLTSPAGGHKLDRLLAVVLTPDGKTTCHAIALGQAQLAERIADLADACCSPRREYGDKARALYSQLVAPIEARIMGKKRLIVCPDGPLWELPFAVLQNRAGRSMLSRFELAYEYSATSLRTAITMPPRHSTGTALAMADPDFGDEKRFSEETPLALSRAIDSPARAIDSPARDILTRGGGVRPLPNTKREAEALVSAVPKSISYLGADAQESTFKREAGKYRYLHLATHGWYNDASPMLSCLVLAQPPKGDPEDGLLTARELLEMKLNADMVVLSACKTGLGEKRAGEGIVGLTWALQAAGVPTQVVSQWSVDDSATADLMSAFYRGIAAGRGKAAALRAAALALAKDGKHTHPYYWAPFILVGDWR